MTAESVLAALRRGDVFLSASPAGPRLYLDAEGGRVRVVSARGASLHLMSDAGVVDAAAIDAEDVERKIALPRDARWVRAQVTDVTGSVLALTNPIWR